MENVHRRLVALPEVHVKVPNYSSALGRLENVQTSADLDHPPRTEPEQKSKRRKKTCIYLGVNIAKHIPLTI